MAEIDRKSQAEKQPLLATYQTLVQAHANHFQPELDQLRHFVTERLDALRQQEQDFIATQTVELERLTQILQQDMRCLLDTLEFEAFVRTLKLTPSPFDQAFPALTIPDDLSVWQVTRLAEPLRLSNYRSFEQPNLYDGRRKFTATCCSLTLTIGKTAIVLSVEIARSYPDEPPLVVPAAVEVRRIWCNLPLLLSIQPWTPSDRQALIPELSCLLCFARSVLALQPHSVQFEYRLSS